jgi:ADP-heptose:LPS heptosyltransferase
VIILCPESRRSEKEWPHFQQLAEELARVFPSHGVLIIGRKKLDLRFPCGDVCNLTGSTSIGDVAWLIERAAAVVSNDSAPMHLAAAMNVPVVALFGPTDPAKFGPYAMQRVNSCAKNVKHSVIRADGGRMQSIQLGAVVDAIGISLDANGQPSPVAQSTRNGENSAS